MYYVYITRLGKSVAHDEIIEFPDYNKARDFVVGYLLGVERKVNLELTDRFGQPPLVPYAAEDLGFFSWGWYVCDISNPEDRGTVLIILQDPPSTSPSVISLIKK